MKSRHEVFEELYEVQPHFENVLTDILDDEPDGLRLMAIRNKLLRHPDWDTHVQPFHLSQWLAELSDEIVIRDWEDRVHIAPKHADKRPDAYRPNLGFPQHSPIEEYSTDD